jgi:hypothetical protein
MVIAHSDGTVTRHRITPKVEMLFERTYKVGINTAFAGEGGATNLYRLAWEAERADNNGAVIKEFEGWADEVDTVDVDVEDVRPFVAGASATSSPRSPSPPA